MRNILRSVDQLQSRSGPVLIGRRKRGLLPRKWLAVHVGPERIRAWNTSQRGVRVGTDRWSSSEPRNDWALSIRQRVREVMDNIGIQCRINLADWQNSRLTGRVNREDTRRASSTVVYEDRSITCDH